jgi:plasmid stabilization system protein ParE
MSEGSGQEPDPSDEFDRELRALSENPALGTRFREPSAAERAKLAKQARKQAARDAKQTRRGRRKERGTGRRRQLTAWGIVIVILAGGGALTWARFGHSSSGSPDDT